MLYLHLIEDFWPILEKEVYKERWVATSEVMLECRIQSALASPDTEVLRTMMKGVVAHVRAVIRFGDT